MLAQAPPSLHFLIYPAIEDNLFISKLPAMKLAYNIKLLS